MTFRELFELMRRHIEDNPTDAAIDREVVVRVSTRDDGGDEDLHVGGLRSASVDAGHADDFSLTLDADEDPPVDEFEDGEDTVEDRPS